MRGGTSTKLHQGQQNPNINSNSCMLSPCRKGLCGIFSIWLSRSTLHASPLCSLAEEAEPCGLHRWALCLLASGSVQPVRGTSRRQKSREKVRAEILLSCFSPHKTTAPNKPSSLQFCSLPLPQALSGRGRRYSLLS